MQWQVLSDQCKAAGRSLARYLENHRGNAKKEAKRKEKAAPTSQTTHSSLFTTFGAIEGTRTPTPLRVHGPEPCASANSATMASGLSLQRRPKSRRIRKTTSLSYNAAPICQNRFTSSLTLAGQPVVVGMPSPSFVIRIRTIRFVQHVEHFRQLFAIVWRAQPDHHFRQMRVVQTVVRHAQESCARVLKLFRPGVRTLPVVGTAQLV